MRWWAKKPLVSVSTLGRSMCWGRSGEKEPVLLETSDHSVLKATGKWVSLLTSGNEDQCECGGGNGAISSLFLRGRLEPLCPGDGPRRREPEGGTTETLDYMVEWRVHSRCLLLGGIGIGTARQVLSF